MRTMKNIWAVILLVLPASGQMNQAGKATFETKCATCHGADGNGGEFAAGIVARIPNRSDEEIATTVRNGLPNRGMPPVSMTADQSKQLIAYLRTLRPPRRGALAATPVTV